MRPLTLISTIDAPREEVFDYLADISNHVEFTDHFIREFRLERLESSGVGAAARFRIASPLMSMWTEAVIAALERPYRISIEGQTGRIGRIKLEMVYLLTPHDQDMTRVELRLSSTPATRTDALREMLGLRSWLRLQWRRALRRLKSILEEGEPSAHAARVAPG